MLTLTSSAASQLNTMLKTSTDRDQAVLRMVRRDGRFSFCVDDIRPGDETFQFNDRVVLALDTTVARRVTARTLDVRQVDGRPRLRFSRT